MLQGLEGGQEYRVGSIRPVDGSDVYFFTRVRGRLGEKRIGHRVISVDAWIDNPYNTVNKIERVSPDGGKVSPQLLLNRSVSLTRPLLLFSSEKEAVAEAEAMTEETGVLYRAVPSSGQYQIIPSRMIGGKAQQQQRGGGGKVRSLPRGWKQTVDLPSLVSFESSGERVQAREMPQGGWYVIQTSRLSGAIYPEDVTERRDARSRNEALNIAVSLMEKSSVGGGKAQMPSAVQRITELTPSEDIGVLENKVVLYLFSHPGYRDFEGIRDAVKSGFTVGGISVRPAVVLEKDLIPVLVGLMRRNVVISSLPWVSVGQKKYPASGHSDFKLSGWARSVLDVKAQEYAKRGEVIGGKAMRDIMRIGETRVKKRRVRGKDRLVRVTRKAKARYSVRSVMPDLHVGDTVKILSKTGRYLGKGAQNINGRLRRSEELAEVLVDGVKHTIWVLKYKIKKVVK